MKLKTKSILILLMICSAWTAEASDKILPSSLPAQEEIAKAASCGAGNSAGKNKCYRGVKSIVAAGLGKSESCVRNTLSSVNAVDAAKDLRKAGFIDNRNKCEEKGTIRVYRGIANGMTEKQAARYIRKNFHANLTAGDRAGHVEVIGSDGGYYSFLKSFRPITENPRLKERRILEGCFVIDPVRYKSSPLAKCSGSAHRCGYSQGKTHGTPHRHHHTGGNQ